MSLCRHAPLRDLPCIRIIAGNTGKSTDVFRDGLECKCMGIIAPALHGWQEMQEAGWVWCILTLGLPVQALCRVLPLRNFFILPQNYSSCKSLLVHRFGALLRKAWNPRQFKGQVWD